MSECLGAWRAWRDGTSAVAVQAGRRHPPVSPFPLSPAPWQPPPPRAEPRPPPAPPLLSLFRNRKSGRPAPSLPPSTPPEAWQPPLPCRAVARRSRWTRAGAPRSLVRLPSLPPAPAAPDVARPAAAMPAPLSVAARVGDPATMGQRAPLRVAGQLLLPQMPGPARRPKRLETWVASPLQTNGQAGAAAPAHVTLKAWQVPSQADPARAASPRATAQCLPATAARLLRG